MPSYTIGEVVLRKNPDPALKEMAESRNIPTSIYENINAEETVSAIASGGYDVGISISYNQIFSQKLLRKIPFRIINYHAGYLPKYRGCNVINWAIINDEKELGLTVHYIEEGIDTGGIICQKTIPITDQDDYKTMLEQAVEGCPGLIVEALDKIQDPSFTPIAQSHLPGSYFSGRREGDEWIDWNWSSRRIFNFIRAITLPGPGARTCLDRRILKILKSSFDADLPSYISTPGEIIGRNHEKGLLVKTGDSSLWIREIYDEAAGETVDPKTFKIGMRLGLNPGTLYHLYFTLSERET